MNGTPDFSVTAKDIVGLSDYDLPWQPPGHQAVFFQNGDKQALRGCCILKWEADF